MFDQELKRVSEQSWQGQFRLIEDAIEEMIRHSDFPTFNRLYDSVYNFKNCFPKIYKSIKSLGIVRRILDTVESEYAIRYSMGEK